MTTDDLILKFKEMFNWNDIEFELYSKELNSLSDRHNHDNEKIIMALLQYKDGSKKFSCVDFFKNAEKLVNRIEKQQKASIYANPDIGFIIESLLDSMEYSLQKKVGNEEMTTRLNRKNYKRIICRNYTYEDLNKKLDSFVIYADGAIEIVPEKREKFIEQLQGLIGSDKTNDTLRVYLVNYYWDFEKWPHDITVPLTADFQNDIIIQTNNDAARSIQDICQKIGFDIRGKK